jgi:hypothetical protein
MKAKFGIADGLIDEGRRPVNVQRLRISLLAGGCAIIHETHRRCGIMSAEEQ